MNVASYKFALAESLLEPAPTEKTEISFEELADPYSRHLCEHLKTAPKQVTSRSSQFLDACTKFNKGEILHDELISVTVEKWFNNVIDTFHVETVTLTIKADEEKYHNTV
ncbi:hypothetical protein [Clostridium saccharobutylicum]|uniref:hypothetical protein n=1 Tax=Clostridium saccharobutylicum TaxID=169679 RepID=UPI0012DA6F01|nr:hypothetical protein [Clostridium saccharobutylicum]MBA2906562.1 hypothetical protein [Clostridium saccharobutylicum]MBA8897837.1 hypothetical protein [Clostridium saccharobutylicum]MBA8983964.1 hypothetical protein [Clostridium saccharobutylicum]MBA8997465.1 hypothetical protein [Clostridium saccharobutylicum]MBA9008902.1 hypothetical protein [Clostridium saccharobutylicum]